MNTLRLLLLFSASCLTLPAQDALQPAAKDIVDAVGAVAPKGQLTPDAAAHLHSLAERLEAAASIFDYGLYTVLFLSLAAVLNSLRFPRTAAFTGILGFGCAFMIPYVQFSVLSLVGVVACLVVLLRPSKIESAGDTAKP